MDAKVKLIGLYSPEAGSGKSEVARILGQFAFREVKFAGPLKAMARALFEEMDFDCSLIEAMIDGSLKEAPIPGMGTATPRQIMQTLGTDWGREAMKADLWTKIAEERIHEWHAFGLPVVVDDVRFPNEAMLIKDLGGKLVRVTRPNPSRPGSSRYEGLLKEAAFDHEIVNDGSLEDLADKVYAMLAA